MREMQAVRDFVGSPENILGSTDTKHGEIAEQVHVGVRRALDVLYGRVPAATFDGVPRTGPVDYRVDSVEIQSKYYNGLRNTLEGVSRHSPSRSASPSRLKVCSVPLPNVITRVSPRRSTDSLCSVLPSSENGRCLLGRDTDRLFGDQFDPVPPLAIGPRMRVVSKNTNELKTHAPD